ncbi:Os11g0641600 [Oryza sativa Japonica Group]|uniref:Os11g0641600 protein n=1 Tax=Oryza sativa subsp. japonica TaxID=39947 RepID=A0A0P0Y4T0_ORYSJ|nr:Os11g0641600 [Oryza sativa Japonica Group]
MANLYKRDYSSRSLLLQFRYKLDFDKSVDLFVHRSSKPKLSLDDDDEEEEEVSDIAVLSGQSFECLQSTLKRLANFFAENAMVLEEINVDDGNQ